MGDVVQLMPLITNGPEADDEVKFISTARLKIAWDKWDADLLDDHGCFILEAIHAEMNERGEGSYVAV